MRTLGTIQLVKRLLDGGVREGLALWVAVTVLLGGLYWVGQAGVGFVEAHLPEAAALLFWGLPVLISDRRREDLGALGWRTPTLRELAWGAGAIAIVLPLFVVGYAWWNGALGRLPHARLVLHEEPLLFPLTQLVVVAIPEELFYRGFLLDRLTRRFPGGPRLAGVTIGPAFWLTAALFGLGHFLVDLRPGRLAVFFPSTLFAFLRLRTGGLAAGVMFHAACNVTIDACWRSLLR